MHIKAIKNFAIDARTVISFDKASVGIPFASIFAREKAINISIVNPRLRLDRRARPPERTGKKDKKLPFKINFIKITNGQLFLKTKKEEFHLLHFNLNSASIPGQTLYRLESRHLKVIFHMSGDPIALGGEMKCQFNKPEDQPFYRITGLTWKPKREDSDDMESLTLNGSGKFFADNTFFFDAQLQGSPYHILHPPLKALSPDGFMNGSARITRSNDKKITITGEFRIPSVTIDEEPFNNFEGRIAWDNQSKILLLHDSRVQADSLVTELNIRSDPPFTDIEIKNIRADKLARVIDIDDDIPLGGLVYRGTANIHRRDIKGTIDLDFGEPNPDKFLARGIVEYTFNSKTKEVEFKTERLETEFGSISLWGKSIPKKKKELTIKLNAFIDEASGINKYMKFYTHLDLAPWNLAGGTGKLKLDLRKQSDFFFFNSRLDLYRFYSNQQDIASLSGTIGADRSIIKGNLEIQDPQLKGDVKLYIDDDLSRIDFNGIDGESRKLFAILDISIPVQGRAEGRASYTLKEGDERPLIRGTFKGSRIMYSPFWFDNLNGNFETDTNYVHLKDLTYQYHKGQGITDLRIDYELNEFRVDGQIRNIDIRQMQPDFKGIGDLVFKGAGKFAIDPIDVDLRLQDVYFYRDRKFQVQAGAKIFTDFSNFKIASRGDILSDSLRSPFDIALNQENDRYSGSFNLNLKDINLLIPWKNNSGQIDLNGQISTDDQANIELQGIANFKGAVLAFPNFPHTLDDFSGFITFHNATFSLKSLQGQMGDGPVEGNGYLKIGGEGIEDLLLSLSGKNMTLYPMDRIACKVNADLNLKYIPQRDKLLLQGNLNFLSGLWEREIDEGVSFYTNPNLSAEESKLLEMLEFDLQMAGKENIRVKNSFASGWGKFNLHLTGNPDFPVLAGTIESRDGEVYFSDHEFKLIKAKLRFNRNYLVEPTINMESESFIKNYRIKFNIKGTIFHPRPEFQSSPPLPQQDILALISLGELFQRPVSTELSSQIGGTGMLTTALTEKIQKRAKKFGIDILKIDPIIAGTSREGTSRFTVGTSIARDIVLVYSTNISTYRQEIYYLQYQLSPNISLIGMRNADGRFSIDLRFRKRR